jgi:hypothetical protein
MRGSQNPESVVLIAEVEIELESVTTAESKLDFELVDVLPAIIVGTAGAPRLEKEGGPERRFMEVPLELGGKRHADDAMWDGNDLVPDVPDDLLVDAPGGQRWVAPAWLARLVELVGSVHDGVVNEVPMTVGQLRAKLAGEPQSSLVSLDGQRSEETFVFEHRGEGWLVYFLERGEKRASRSTEPRTRPAVTCSLVLNIDHVDANCRHDGR